MLYFSNIKHDMYSGAPTNALILSYDAVKLSACLHFVHLRGRLPDNAYNDDPPSQTIKVCWLGGAPGYPPPLPAAPEERMRQVSAASLPADRRDVDAPDDGRVH